MNVTWRWTLCALLFAAPSALAQDEIALGSPLPAAPGEVVSVPVLLHDAAETPLGAGGLAPIQWIDLSITHSRPDVIHGCLGTTYPNCDLQFKAAGQLAASTPETSSTLTNIDSLFVRRIFGGELHFTGGRDLIGYFTFRIDPEAPLGTVIQLKFDSAKTFLANHDGTIVDRALKLSGTSITIAPARGPTLDFVGLTILVILLAAAGLFVMNRLAI